MTLPAVHLCEMLHCSKSPCSPYIHIGPGRRAEPCEGHCDTEGPVGVSTRRGPHSGHGGPRCQQPEQREGEVSAAHTRDGVNEILSISVFLYNASNPEFSRAHSNEIYL